ncbi:MAG: hypothetical protein HDT38_00280 [Clostridiales bacterium]|nr:hypothetical protein [Clostridiales bacterium]
MEWPKLKNLIILILLTVNGFLLVLVGARREEAANYERLALERTAQVLEQGGVRVELDALAAMDRLSPAAVERDVEGEARLACALLGEELQGDNRGGGLYLYRGELGEVSLRSGGELSASFEEDGRWQTDHPESHAAALLEKMGIKAEQTGLSTQGEETAVRFRQLWDGVPVFSCEVELSYRDGELRSLRGTLLIAKGSTAEAGQALTLPTALMRFSEGMAAAGDVCSAIRSMEAGYRGHAQSLSGGVRLTPVWLVATDTANYYLDGITGALTRVAE